MFRKAVLALALASTVIASNASAHDGRRWNNPYRDRHSDTGTAVVAGVIGLALGMAIANSSQRHEDRYYNDPDREYDYDRSPYERDLFRRGYYFYRGYYYGPDGYYYRERFYRDQGYGYRYYYRYRGY